MSKSKEIMHLLKEIQNALDKGLKTYYTDYQLTVPQLTVVTMLGKNDKMMITDISKEMMISAAAVSGIIDRLEANGLVKRARSEKDKRKVFVSLTDSFKMTHKHLDCNISGYLHLLLRTQSKIDVETIVNGLNLLNDLLKEGENVLSSHITKHSEDKM